MNYRHIYHAGNFADVFKHIVLICLLQSLQKKDKAFCYLDTHAGIGRYDLFAEQAQKTHEYENGVAKIFAQQEITFAEVQCYIDIIQSLNKNNELRHYPGSPYIARQLLRPQDRMILCELHPEDVRTLKQEFFHDKQIAVHQQDGYQAMKAFLPPKENRGLVFIDPPYEKTNEVDQIIHTVELALKHWANGIYAIWYPIKDKLLINRLKKKLETLANHKILFTELQITPNDPEQTFINTGIAIINPPWQLDTRLNAIIPWLKNLF